MNYYNENDSKTAAWLRELIKAGHIADGIVDERSITDILPGELDGYAQCHFFAGIGGWSLALRLSGWPDDEPVWTGSCPCQPFSNATRGEGKRLNSDKHLWPIWHKLISQRKPHVIFGEQVASALDWLDVVWSDMEASNYTFWPTIIPALCVGKDHKRERIYFASHSNSDRKPILQIHGEASWMPGVGSDASSVVWPHGVSKRMAYRGFGNAIVPEVAAEFIKAFREAIK